MHMTKVDEKIVTLYYDNILFRGDFKKKTKKK